MLSFKPMIVEKVLSVLSYWAGGGLGGCGKDPQIDIQGYNQMMDDFKKSTNDADDRLIEVKLLEVPRLSEFLLNLRAGFGVKNILYPGCRYDAKSLSEAFSPDEIFYMDNDPKVFTEIHGRFDQAQNIFVEDVADSHFPDEYFDAIYLKDLHEEYYGQPRNLAGALRMLRIGGLLIHSNFDCGADEVISSRDVRIEPNMRMFPTTTVNYTVFQKVA